MKVHLAVFVIVLCCSITLHGQAQTAAGVPFAGCYAFSRSGTLVTRIPPQSPADSSQAMSMLTNVAPIFSNCEPPVATIGRNFGYGGQRATVSGSRGEQDWVDFAEP